MRKNRFLALQKMAEQKKSEAMNASNAALSALGNGGPDGHGMPKQTVWSGGLVSSDTNKVDISAHFSQRSLSLLSVGVAHPRTTTPPKNIKLFIKRISMTAHNAPRVKN